MKFLNESYCISYNADGALVVVKVVTDVIRARLDVRSDDSNGASTCVRKRRMWHLFAAGSPAGEEKQEPAVSSASSSGEIVE